LLRSIKLHGSSCRFLSVRSCGLTSELALVSLRQILRKITALLRHPSSSLRTRVTSGCAGGVSFGRRSSSPGVDQINRVLEFRTTYLTLTSKYVPRPPCELKQTDSGIRRTSAFCTTLELVRNVTAAAVYGHLVHDRPFCSDHYVGATTDSFTFAVFGNSAIELRLVVA